MTPRTLSAVLLLLALTVPPAAADPSPDPLDQTIDVDQGTGTGQVVLTRGHVDIGPRLDPGDGAVSLEVHDDTVEPSVWRSLDDVVLSVPKAALQTVPSDPAYAFLHADPGSRVHVLPQTQQSDVVWVGWNTQEPRLTAAVQLGATLTLHAAHGPGDVLVYLQSGSLEKPQVLWDSTRSSAQDLWVDSNTHTHGNWVFTKPGVYLLDVGVSATLKGGRTVQDRETLRFAVGVPAAEAFAASEPPRSDSGQRDGDDQQEAADDGDGLAVRAAVAGLAVAATAGVLLPLLASRRRRRLRREVP